MANRVTLATRYSWKTEDHWQPDIHGKQRDNGDLLFMANRGTMDTAIHGKQRDIGNWIFMANRGTLATRYSWQTEGHWRPAIHGKQRDPGN